MKFLKAKAINLTVERGSINLTQSQQYKEVNLKCHLKIPTVV